MIQQFVTCCIDFIELNDFEGTLAQKLNYIRFNFRAVLDHFYDSTILDDDFNPDEVYFAYTMLKWIPTNIIFGHVDFADLVINIIEALRD